MGLFLGKCGLFLIRVRLIAILQNDFQAGHAADAAQQIVAFAIEGDARCTRSCHSHSSPPGVVDGTAPEGCVRCNLCAAGRPKIPIVETVYKINNFPHKVRVLTPYDIASCIVDDHPRAGV